MPERTDIDYFWPVSPRRAIIRDGGAEPTSLSVEDIVDTFRNDEADIGGSGLDSIDDKQLLEDATGRDDLGSDVEVGITATGLDLVVGFKARTTPISTATEDMGDATGTLLSDAGATFQADGVGPGDVVINFTDQSMGSVLRVLSQTQLELDGLTGGSDNQFDISDDCKVYDVVQCEISGGNWVAVDSVGDAIPSVFPTFGTQIVRTSASSATTQNQQALEHGLYNGGVTVDVVNGEAGTTGLIGTPKQPSNNIPDAVIIAGLIGLTSLFIRGDLTLTTGDDVRNLLIYGESADKSMVTVDAAALVSGSEFYEWSIQGTLDGNSVLDHCHIENLDYVEGEIRYCVLHGTITLGGSGDTLILDSKSGVAGAGTPTIDYGGSGRTLQIRAYSGGIKIINKTGPDDVSIDMISGHAILDSTVTDGTIVIRGANQITNNSTGTAVVIAPDAYHIDNVLRLIESQRGHHTATGNIFYWDPIGGNDANDGLSSGTAKLTWGGVSGVNSLVMANNHDVVIVIPGEPGGTTVITEQWVADKEYTLIRAPGRDVVCRPTATTGETVSIEAEGCELSGMRIETAATGDGEALVITADFCFVHDIWVEMSQGDGIRLQNVSHATLVDIMVRNCAGNGVVFRGTTQDCKYNMLSDALIIDNGGDGVLFTGVNCQQNYVWGGEEGVSIMSNGGWGINEEDNADFNHSLGPIVHIHGNALGDTNFIGTDSGDENTGDIAAKVWEQIAESGYTFAEVIRIVASILAGKATATQNPNRAVYRDLNDTKDRADFLHSDDGDRTEVTLDGS